MKPPQSRWSALYIITSLVHFRVFGDNSGNGKLSWVCLPHRSLCRPALFLKKPVYIGLDSVAPHMTSASLAA